MHRNAVSSFISFGPVPFKCGTSTFEPGCFLDKPRPFSVWRIARSSWAALTTFARQCMAMKIWCHGDLVSSFPAKFLRIHRLQCNGLVPTHLAQTHDSWPTTCWHIASQKRSLDVSSTSNRKEALGERWWNGHWSDFKDAPVGQPCLRTQSSQRLLPPVRPNRYWLPGLKRDRGMTWYDLWQLWQLAHWQLTQLEGPRNSGWW